MSRWRTLGWFLATLLLLWWLVWPSSQSSKELSRPNSQDSAGQGLAGLVTWLKRSNIEVHSQRLRFSDMPDDIATATGNLAIVHLPGTLIYDAEEIQALLEWVARGNTLLLAAGYLEGPDWVYSGSDIHRSLWRLSGLGVSEVLSAQEEAELQDESEREEWQETLQDVVEDAKENLDEVLDDVPEPPVWMREQRGDERLELRTQTPHRLTRGLAVLTVPWDSARWELVSRELQYDALARRADEEDSVPQDAESEDDIPPVRAVRTNLSWFDDMEACENSLASPRRSLSGKTGCLDIPTPGEADWQVLLSHPDSEQPALLAAPLEHGELLALWHPSLLANGLVHRFQNRQFAVRLIDTYLADEGVVIIDDAHQGLNSIIESEDLLTDSRFYATVGFLLLFWVAYLLADSGQWERASRRVRTPAVGQMDLVGANANFMRNRMGAAATRELMLERLRNHLARKWRLPHARALQEGLARERSLVGTQPDPKIARLEASLEALGRGGKVAPLALQQQIDALIHSKAVDYFDTKQGED